MKVGVAVALWNRTPYAKNPFDSVSDQELEEYKRQVEMSQKGIVEEDEVEELSYSTSAVDQPLTAEAVTLSANGEPLNESVDAADATDAAAAEGPTSDTEEGQFESIVPRARHRFLPSSPLGGRCLFVVCWRLLFFSLPFLF